MMRTEEILSIKDLTVIFHTAAGDIPAIRDLSLSIGRGEIAAVVGESGCGKSVLCRTIMGLLPQVAEVTGGSIRLGVAEGNTASMQATEEAPVESSGTLPSMQAGMELIGLSDREYCRIRGRDMAMVFQDPYLSLDPRISVGRQIAEAIRVHDRSTPAARAREKSIALMEDVGIDRAAKRYDAQPWMLSGGMRQRCVLAMALSQDPRLLIADEITTALDVTIQAEILDLLLDLRDRHHLSVLFITHDLRACARVADTVHIMRDGQFLESGPASSVLRQPTHPYTKALLQAAGGETPAQGEACPPHSEPASMPTVSAGESRTGDETSPAGERCADGGVIDDTASSPLLQVQGLSRSFPLGRGEIVRAVQDVSLGIHAGEVFALVGESGSGKTTLARCILGMLPPDSGQVRYAGQDISARAAGFAARGRASTSVHSSDAQASHAATSPPPPRLSRELRRRLAREIQFISQDPGAALDPRMTVRQLIAEPLQIHRVCPSRQSLETRIRSALAEVQLTDDLLDRFPAELSGGQKQRVSIARAYCMDPKLLVADEPTASLDVSIQAQIIRLLVQLQQIHGTALLFISHDLALVEQISDRVGVMYRGELVEQAPAARLFTAPQHPYTKRLLAVRTQLFHESGETMDL